MKFKCKICKLKFRAKELDVICPRCKRRGVVPYNDHSSGILLLFALIILWSVNIQWFPYPRFLWFFIGAGILGLGMFVEFIFWIVRKSTDPKFYIDKATGEVHYFSEFK